MNDTLQDTIVDIAQSGYEAAKGGNSDEDFVDRAISLHHKISEMVDLEKTIKASLRMTYIQTGEKELHGTKQSITVSDPKDKAYMNDDYDVVIDTNNYNPTSVLKALKRAVEDGKVSKRTLERCRKVGTKKVPLTFPVSK